MTANALKDIEQIESSLWEAADQLRSNSKLTSSEYVMPVLGIIFLRHAANRYYVVKAAIEADQAAGRMPKRPLIQADFKKRRAMMLPHAAQKRPLLDALATFAEVTTKTPPAGNAEQHAARHAFAPLADRTKGLVKQIDLLYKLAARAAQLAQDLAGAHEAAAERYDRRALCRTLKQLDAERKVAVEQLKLAVYVHRQILWLQERFPDAAFAAVPGLCKAVTRAEIEAADCSLTPGRYVGVAPPEEDEGFDFEQTLRDIHVELADLNREAAELAARIQENFDEIQGANSFALSPVFKGD
ncbi:type I restriction-modification system subunit M N-terminal domain-containing protein [Thiorhodococcus mannitoliphagus]|uniref:type I restriction-modification system subunit M N-terminal domain-containing protein n=1 Tax=Thiorhodococcus mannitoliphagus TaxID=329406 RepID=UPI001F0F397E|nr:type I restriction-modification system subunit M N-terminal domain-containing protein [Thiorhodococcus mannitoliphagus]